MPRKKESVIKVETLIAAKRNAAEQIHSQLEALDESIAELEALAASLKPKPRKAKKDIGVSRIENQPE